MTPATKRKRAFNKSRKLSKGSLPRNKFGTISGTYDHFTFAAHDGIHEDDNHVYFWINVTNDEHGGMYEAAINTQSSDTSEVMYTEVEEEQTELPREGFLEEGFAYTDVDGLDDADFVKVKDGRLRTLLIHYAEQCDKMSILGFTYSQGNGIHDVHMNSGEKAGSKYPNHKDQDGAAIFYFNTSRGTVARWILIKFQTQSLTRA